MVKTFTSFGAFVDLGGFDGLLHVNDMRWGHVASPKDAVVIGEEVNVKVIRIDRETQKVNLSLKHFTPDPWTTFEERYGVDDVVTGKVSKITDFGAFIEVDSSIDGLIHISDLSWNKRINHPSEVLKVGDEVETVVLSIDPENRRLSLGLKQLSDDAWEGFFTRHQEGDLVDGTVLRFADFGAFVQIEEGIEGLLRLNDIDEPPPSKAEDRLHLGQPLKLRIVRLSRDDRKVGLSLKAAEEGYSGHGETGEVSVKIGDVWKR
jgi:small subunit ribosomal protein S1